ncbi:MAG: HNH endonuclease signature motif containing protein [Caldilineaceae bacterium]|nr:HNH endonuclease signature motif containing protein [Caldilineaceae bacterium]
MASREARRVYNSRRWAAVRAAVLDAAGWRCGRCGRAGRLEVHHRVALADGGPAFDPANLAVLCRDCHFRGHGKAAPLRRPDRRAWRAFAAGEA